MGRAFWAFSGESRLTRSRMIVEPILSRDAEFSLWQGQPVPRKRPIRVKVHQVPRVEDMPWCFGPVPIVSTALRDIIARRENRIDFLSAKLGGRLLRVLPKDYWVLNCLRILPCHDKRRSEFMCLRGNERVLSRFVFDGRRIPRHVHVFRVRYLQTRLLVSDELRHDIEAAKLSGCQFHAPGTPIPFW